MPLKAVAGIIDLTPKDPTKRVPLLGFNRFSYTCSDGLPWGLKTPFPDEIYARILMLRRDSGGDPVVIVALDAVSANDGPVKVRNPREMDKPLDFPRPLPSDTTAKWCAAAHLPAGSPNLSIHATHTHYAPALDHDRVGLVGDAIRKLAETPANSWTPVTVHGGVVRSSLPVSRLLGKQDDPNIDRSLIVLDFRGPDSKSVARLINLGVHPTGLTLPDEGLSLLSPDFVGCAMNLLDKKGGVSLFLQGWSGDVGPCNQNGDRSYQKMKSMSETFKEEIEQALAAAKPMPGDALRVVRVTKSGVAGSPDFDARFNPSLEGVDTKVEFRAIAIGNKVVIVAVSGEVYQDYGPILTTIPKDVEGEKPFMPSCGLANGYSGYIPTDWGFGNYAFYEVNTSPFKKGVEGGMIDAFSQLFAALEASS